jgi:hypothetical protein
MNADDKLFFSLVLLAVAIAAVTVVTAAWINSTREDPFFFVPVEQLKITNLEFNSNNMATVTIKNFGSRDVTMNSAKINGQPATLKSIEEPMAIIRNGTSANFTTTFKDGSQFNLGEQYQFTIVTTKGTLIKYTATYSLN